MRYLEAPCQGDAQAPCTTEMISRDAFLDILAGPCPAEAEAMPRLHASRTTPWMCYLEAPRQGDAQAPGLFFFFNLAK